MSESTSFPISATHFGDLDEAACDGCQGEGRQLGFEFSYAFQPIVDLRVGSIYAYEALVRGPNGESAGCVLAQVTDHNRYRFDQACRVKAIKDAVRLGLGELPETRLSINFLPNAVYRPEACIRTTLAAARSQGLPLERIIFETTEGERVGDGRWYAEVMSEYRRIGFLNAIDDFGAGYAGLALLADFQPDLIKLDMGLLRDVDSHRPRQHIIKAVLDLCREMGVQVIAEGVETLAERDWLWQQGARLMQGYLFARPAFQRLVPADEIEALLR
ncbi:diguanylate phosphodiesterase [Paucibacter aquatile]|uniref:Diguanylate phosphodiesterase n=1 Tax=Kinneretia aquatilis TaxID=2070761 RepID=A0A2N8KVQ1_9BURK|nr:MULTISPECIES: EAL domain-containing protein [Roseateles]PND37539.1 diguanylate phosphodiesterase [Paucibacter aquatile]